MTAKNRKRLDRVWAVKHPTCGFCKSRGYGVDHKTQDGRPRFTCSQCGRWWTCGRDGGVYLGWAKMAVA